MQVSEKVTLWKQKLLDTGKRNRLLFFKPTKRSTLQLLEPAVGAIFDRLVHEAQAYEFPLPLAPEPEPAGAVPAGTTNVRELPPLRPGQVRADQSEANLMKTLYQLRQKSKTALQEQGVNILYVAFGFLQWTEAEASHDIIRSPLVLVPVQLDIESILDPYVLTPFDDDLTLNPTLLHKLQTDFGIGLPALPDEDGWTIDGYLDTVQEQVDKKGWKVAREAQVGLFSFLKLNMYKDLDAFGEAMAEHPILAAIAGDPSRLPGLPEDLLEPQDMDRKIYPHETFQVLDADSSQQEAILAAKRGASFVLQGPPGTGKSQTITNMIAECLAAGKRVLFVSEKMAALEVVFRRLQDNGLADFSLQLHSHNANKKEVVGELGRTLQAARTAGTDRVEEQLDQLLAQRESLNAVVEALHKVREPLGRSIYDVHGEVAGLEGAPNLGFQFPEGAASRTPADLRRFSQLLEQFAATAGRVGADYVSNPWKGCIAPAFTLGLQQDIRTHFQQLQAKLAALDTLFVGICERLGLERPATLAQMDRAAELLALVGESPMPPAGWFAQEALAPLMQTATDHLELTARHEERRGRLLRQYREGLLGIDADSRIRSLESLPPAILPAFVTQYLSTADQLISARDELQQFLEAVVSRLGALREAGDALAGALAIDWDGTAASGADLVAVGRLASSDPRPLAAWFEAPSLRPLVSRAREAREAYTSLQASEEAFLRRYEREIFALDIAGMLQRFRSEYDGFFRFLKSGYRRDLKALRSLLKAPAKLSHEQAVADLTAAKEILERRRWVQEYEPGLEEAFGPWFQGAATPWDELVAAVETTSSIVDHYRPEAPPAGLRDLLIRSGAGIRTVTARLQTAEAAVAAAAPVLQQIGARLRPNAPGVPAGAVENRSAAALQDWAAGMLSTVREFYQAYDDAAQFAMAPVAVKVPDLVQDLRLVVQVQETEEQLRREAGQLQETFGHFFQGVDTEWQAVLNSLDWTASVVRYFEPAQPSEAFVRVVSGDAAGVTDARRAAVESGRLLEEAQREADFVVGLFEPRIIDPKRPPVALLQEWLQTRLDSLNELQNWIDFRVSREECARQGLGSFVAEALERRIPPAQLKPAFYKRFYRLWLDELYAQVPELQSFRGRLHEDRIQEFRKLDRLQFKLAQIRLRAKLSALRPNPHAMAARGAEISVLQREVEKRRRQMPLRKLFQAIPNLLLTLKPCLLMSPLSVSQFLDPSQFKFDVVIFDEASQICSEDAIGAIFRGEQLIVVGDREQLPPTNFFGASVADSGFEDEEDDTEAYESILDECSGVLHRKSLRWHYRSRHEHLIAFSNAEIYKDLVTFPSPVDRTPNIGVEYVFVPEGVYDRAGTRSNKLEARRVAQLTFEHFRRFPDRSLGIVTFSEAQQSIVDAELRSMRLEKPEFERFFSEDRDEPFFVKNLENVQGDERDTIIFSVGYAKDATGVVHMNFGPLSKQGGQRRLNVAITRAKHNVKLVTSMKPTDIDLERTSADGVKMLRRYMEFAMEGPMALQRQLQVSEVPQFDSPFEEAVYKELTYLGYKVDTQVGCSGYRIDLAVKDPNVSGRYLLGIECDGAAYHSAKTARDRDRLREDVLRGLGWRIHRIWSTDWIKDPRAELQRAITAIEEAQAAVGEPEPCWTEEPAAMDPMTGGQPEELLEVEVTGKEGNGAALAPGVTEYREANVWEVDRKGNSDWVYMADVMAHVVAVEGPVHQEIVARRMAPLWNRERVSSQVRAAVAHIAQSYSQFRFERRGEFYWSVPRQSVPVRTPAPGEKPRPTQEICVEERAEAMCLVLQQAVGIGVDDLVVETGRLLGYNRTGAQIREALQESLEWLLAAHRVEVVDGKVHVAR